MAAMLHSVMQISKRNSNVPEHTPQMTTEQKDSAKKTTFKTSMDSSDVYVKLSVLLNLQSSYLKSLTEH